MKKSVGLIIGLVALLAILLGLSGYYLMNGNSFIRLQKAEYQAVFLSNGQVYFGKVFNENSATVTVKDIYYLQVQQPVQQSTDAESAENNTDQQVQLVKLGNEIHGPKDEMRINRDQILFVEDLKDDGKVMTAIRNYQNGNK